MNNRQFLLLSALGLSLAMTAAPAIANDLTDLIRKEQARKEHPKAEKSDPGTFSKKERITLEQYSEQRKKARDRDEGENEGHGKGHGQQKALPPGLQKKVDRGGELPPGWQKKLQRGEVMPADVYRAGRPLPDDVRRKLPPDPKGTITLDVDGEIVRVVEKTREIRDILRQR